MNMQWIDQIFKQQLSKGTAPVPHDLWTRLEPHLPQPQRRNRGGIFWLLGAGFLIDAAHGSTDQSSPSNASLPVQSSHKQVTSSSLANYATKSLQTFHNTSPDHDETVDQVSNTGATPSPSLAVDGQRTFFTFAMLAPSSMLLENNTLALPDPAKDCYDFGGRRGIGADSVQ
jgi:hypothetical protein